MRQAVNPGYFTISALSAYSGLGCRFLRQSLKSQDNPLPHFRINNKVIIISRDDFSKWIQHFRVDRQNEVDEAVKSTLAGIER
jgi:hypothetical protein